MSGGTVASLTLGDRGIDRAAVSSYKYFFWQLKRSLCLHLQRSSRISYPAPSQRSTSQSFDTHHIERLMSPNLLARLWNRTTARFIRHDRGSGCKWISSCEGGVPVSSRVDEHEFRSVQGATSALFYQEGQSSERSLLPMTKKVNQNHQVSSSGVSWSSKRTWNRHESTRRQWIDWGTGAQWTSAEWMKLLTKTQAPTLGTVHLALMEKN